MSQVAFEDNVGMDWSFNTAVDLSANQFYFGVIASGTALVTVAGAGAHPIGVIQDGPVGTTAIPKAVAIRYGGISKVQCGGTFVAGDLLSSDSTGRAVKYTGATIFTGTPYVLSGSYVMGQALAAGSIGTLSTMIVNPSGFSA